MYLCSCIFFPYKKKRIQDASSEEVEAVEFVKLMDHGLVASCCQRSREGSFCLSNP